MSLPRKQTFPIQRGLSFLQIDALATPGRRSPKKFFSTSPGGLCQGASGRRRRLTKGSRRLGCIHLLAKRLKVPILHPFFAETAYPFVL